MKKVGVFLVLFLSITIISCKENNLEATKTEELNEVKPKVVKIVLDSRNKSKAKGKFKFTQEKNTLHIYGKFWDFNSGTYGIRIRKVTDTQNASRSDNNQALQQNDLGVFRIGNAGKSGITMNTKLGCIGCKDEEKNILGKEIIIYKISDDIISKPKSTTVTHISCGGIIK